MEIKITNLHEKSIIFLNGRFDFNEQRAFKTAYDPLLQQASVLTVEVNLAGIEYLDSSALGMLMLFRERAKAVNKSVLLSNPNATVAQILDIANFKKLFAIV